MVIFQTRRKNGSGILYTLVKKVWERLYSSDPQIVKNISVFTDSIILEATEVKILLRGFVFANLEKY